MKAGHQPTSEAQCAGLYLIFTHEDGRLGTEYLQCGATRGQTGNPWTLPQHPLASSPCWGIETLCEAKAPNWSACWPQPWEPHCVSGAGQDTLPQLEISSQCFDLQKTKCPHEHPQLFMWLVRPLWRGREAKTQLWLTSSYVHSYFILFE